MNIYLSALSVLQNRTLRIDSMVPLQNFVVLISLSKLMLFFPIKMRKLVFRCLKSFESERNALKFTCCQIKDIYKL